MVISIRFPARHKKNERAETSRVSFPDFYPLDTLPSGFLAGKQARLQKRLEHIRISVRKDEKLS